MQVRKSTNRREFLRLSALGAGAMLVAACSAPAASPTAAPAAKATTAPAAAATTAPAAGATMAPAAGATMSPAAGATKPAAGATMAPAAGATMSPAAGATKPAAGATMAPAAAASNLTGKLEIFSWWTSGGEVEALNALYDIFKKQNPKVEIVNSALTGGTSSGGNMKAVLQTRLMGGDPPESFQIHLGEELNADHVVAGRMQPLDTFYKDQGYDKVFPKQLLDLADSQGKPWAVPVNVHRTNVLFYSKKLLTSVGAEPPKTWDEWFIVADKLKAKGVAALGITEANPGQVAQVFESVLMGSQSFGAAGYRGLFDGTTSWSDPKIKAGLELVLKMEPYFNKDYLSIQWSDMIDLMIADKAAMFINGDWTPGVLWSKKFTDFGWAACPGDQGVYAITSDAFGLPKGVKNVENAMAWLKVCGSKEGQENFNLLKGSIPVRTDCDISKYTDYHKSAVKEWTDPKTEIVASIVHGVAAKPSFNVDFQTALNVFISKKDVAACQAALVKAAKDAGFKA